MEIWSDIASYWRAQQAAWSETFSGYWQEAERLANELNPTDALVGQVEDVLRWLDQIGKDLDACAALIPALPATEQAAWSAWLTKASAEWESYCAGIYPYLSARPQVEGLPVVLAVPTLAVVVKGAAALAFIIIVYEFIQFLRDEVSLKRSELEARVEALRAGVVLQPSTLEPPSGANEDAAWPWVVGGLVLLGLAGGAAYVVWGGRRG